MPYPAAATRYLDEGGFDCAIVDLNLHGESAASIADRLLEQGKSFLIATGYGSGSVPDRLRRAADRKAVRTRDVTQCSGAIDLRPDCLSRGSDHTKQPKNKDEDQQSAETDIHCFSPLLVLRVKRFDSSQGCSCFGAGTEMTGIILPVWNMPDLLDFSPPRSD